MLINSKLKIIIQTSFYETVLFQIAYFPPVLVYAKAYIYI